MPTVYTIKECLRGYTNETLGAMCAYWRLDATAKESRLKALERVLSDPLHVRRALDDAGPETVRLLAILGRHGETTLTDLARVGGLYTTGNPVEVLAAVLRAGLVLVSPSAGAGVFSLPRIESEGAALPGLPVALHPGLPEVLPAPQPLTLSVPAADAPGEEPAGTDPETASAAFLEVLRIVELCRPRVTHAGTVHRSDLHKAHALAREGGLSADTMGLALMMARELHCVEENSGRLTTTSRAGQWAEAPRHERVRSLFDAFIASPLLSDLRVFLAHLMEPIEAHLPEGSLRRRYHKMLLAAVLRSLEPGAWYGVEMVIGALRRHDQNVLFLNESWRAVHAHARGDMSAYKDRAWAAFEHRYYCWVLTHVLPSLGMSELALEDRLFRLTPVGRYALGLEDGADLGGAEANLDDHDALAVQPDFEIIAFLDRCTPELRRKLDTFCERLRPGRVATYRLTQDSVYRGVRAGTSLAAFIRLLEDHVQRPIPDNVRDQFNIWQNKLCSVTIRTHCQLVECASAEDAEGLLAQWPGARRIGERYVTGSLPAPDTDAELDYAQPMPPCVEQEKALRLRVPWQRVNLFLPRVLRELGSLETTAKGDLFVQLSPKAVENGSDWGLAAAQLEALVREPLAARYRAALRAWAGEGAAGISRTATLVRFADDEMCQAALELEGVGGLVEGRLGLNTAVVAQGCLAQFKRILKEHGIPVQRSGGELWDDGDPAQWAAQWVAQQEAHEPSEAAESSETQSEGKPANGTGLPFYSPRIIREILEDAIARRRPVLIAYQSAWSNAATTRRVNPVNVDTLGPSPTLSGYCHQHQGSRAFKLAQVKGIRVLEDETF